MSKKTKRTIVIIAAAALLTAAAVIIFIVVKANSAGYRSISIAEIFGKVVAQNGGKTYEAYKNMRLADGYELSTDPDSYTRMLLDDDKYVKLEQESHAIFEALGDAKRHITTIRLDKGSLTTEITKPLTESESYVVNTPNAVLAVRGTLFRVEVKQEANGDYYCDVYTYGGSVGSHRIMPDGTHVDEEIVIPAGYKATIKMDEIITVYLEEKIDEEEEDNIDPLHISEVNDGDLVNVYNASAHGHKMFLPTEELWNEITGRDIDLSKFRSLYDGNIILPFEPEDLGDSVISDNSADEDSGAYSSAVISRDPPSGSSSGSSASSGSNDNNTHTPETSQRPVQSGSASLPASSEPVLAESEPSATTSRVPRPESSSGTSSSSNSTSSSSSGSSRPTESSSSSTNTETPEPAVHTHTPVTTTEPATCVTPGSVTVKCAECNELISSESISPLGHTTRTVTTLSTCTEPGKEEQICERCSALLGKKELPLADHTEVAETEGDITTRKCGVCGEIISQTNNVTGVVYPVALDETNFPDPVFLAYVTQFDEDGDGALSLEECDKVTVIDVSGDYSQGDKIVTYSEITSLKGIKYFDNLTTLECGYSKLTELDISNNKLLKNLQCYDTQIKSLDIANNTVLEELDCGINQITSLDVSNNTALTTLWCDNTQITSLDVSKNILLEVLVCYETRITKLDVSQNTALRWLRCHDTQIPFVDISNNPNISKFGANNNKHPIHVENGTFDLNSIVGFDYNKVSELTGAEIDEHGVLSKITEGTEITYTYDCGQGKSATFTLVPDESSTFAPETPEGVEINAENFPDEKFRTYVSTNFDTDGNSYLSQEECDAVTSISVSGSSSRDGNITSLDGIEHFSKLERLVCGYNNGLALLDVSKNIALTYLRCENTQIESLDISNNIALTYLLCSETQIKSLDVRQNIELNSLYCYNAQIPFIDFSNNSKLSVCRVDGNNHPIHIENGMFDLNSIEGFDISRIRDGTLTGAVMDENGILSGITEGTNITYTYDCKHIIATFTLVPDESSTFAPETPGGVAINAENFPDDAFREYISTNIDTDGDGYLSYDEDAFTNELDFSDIDVGSLAGIEYFSYLSRISFKVHIEGGSFDISTIDVIDPDSIRALPAINAELTGTILSGILEGDTAGFLWYHEFGTDNETYFILVPDESSTFEPAITYPVAINSTNFPDRYFMQYIQYNLDPNLDGELSQDECEAVTSIELRLGSSITSLKGIEKFSKLQKLDCGGNRITELDVSKNTVLTYLDCYNTNITSLDLSKNTALTHLECGSTEITSLDVSKNTALTYLSCGGTQISSLDLSKCTVLTNLYIFSTQLTSLDVSKNTALIDFECMGVPITSLDVSKNTALMRLAVSDIQITSLDVSRNTALTELECTNSPVTSLDVKNNTALTKLFVGGTQITSLDISNNLMLEELSCRVTPLPFVDISNNPNITWFDVIAIDCPIIVINGTFDLKSIEGFDPGRIVEGTLEGAIMDENGVLSGITEGTSITYTYDCKGTGESKYMVTFTLVRTAEATASLSDEDDDNIAALPPDDTNTTPPNAPEETGGAPNEDAALPPEDIDGLRFLPLGILALMRDRKRNTAFRVKRKAEI